ncbi:MAG: signal peptidase II [Thermoguttaceae bacterium]|nr:signal peptidase II [Thermoguttaceae bacterium]MBR4752795.1 signal peptidase II [Thermoguttaceae bacterium]
MKDYRARTFRMFLFIAIALVGFAADLGSKHWIFEKLGRPGEQPVWWMIDGVFGFQTSLNQGALFGLGQGQITLFVTLSIIALLGVALWVWTDPGKNLALASTLGLITAGILGNLWDRVGLHHMTWTQFDVDVWSCSQDMVGKPVYAVRDWILVMLGDYPWPNFNIADSCLVVGAILIGVFALFTPAPKTIQVAEEPKQSND